MKKCRLCGSTELSKYYAPQESVKIYNCLRCELKQMITPPEDEVDSTAAEQSVSQDVDRSTSIEDMKINERLGLSGDMHRMAHVMMQDSTRINQTIKQIIDNSSDLDDSSRFIDVGSGYGQHSFNLKEEFPNMDIHLLEISKKRIQSGIDCFRPNLNDFTFYHCLLDDSFANEHAEKFDISFSFHVLEHVYDIRSFIKNIFAITKEGGSIIVEVPNEDDDLCLLSDNYRKIIHFASHVSCFTKDTLTQLVKEAGISKKVEIEFLPIQRYGFFNYIDWVRHNQKDKVLGDDYISRENPSWIERHWLQTKKQNFTTDSIAMILKKRKW